jgi:hypothetical protein
LRISPEVATLRDVSLSPAFIAVTDARTRRAHLVSDAASAAGRSSGRYEAACGVTVLPASLHEPETGRCDACAREAARLGP